MRSQSIRSVVIVSIDVLGNLTAMAPMIWLPSRTAAAANKAGAPPPGM